MKLTRAANGLRKTRDKKLKIRREKACRFESASAPLQIFNDDFGRRSPRLAAFRSMPELPLWRSQ